MADYKHTNTGVTHIPTGRQIPNNLKNRDWREFLRWLEHGNVADPVDAPAPSQTEEELANGKLGAECAPGTVLRAVIEALAARLNIPAAEFLNDVKSAITKK